LPARHSRGGAVFDVAAQGLAGEHPVQSRHAEDRMADRSAGQTTHTNQFMAVSTVTIRRFTCPDR
jgi:hypothetical protein